MGWEKLELKDAYVGTGDTSNYDLVLQIDVHDEYFAPSTGCITLTPEQVAKLEKEIAKWKHLQ